MESSRYLKANRLEDVIFLIQYLGLGQNYALGANTTPPGMTERPPGAWTAIARQHPEFFRVMQNTGTVTLSHRLYLKTGKERPPPLSIENVQKLVENAMALHERQAKRLDAWKTWLTMIGAVVAAATGIAGLFFK